MFYISRQVLDALAPELHRGRRYEAPSGFSTPRRRTLLALVLVSAIVVSACGTPARDVKSPITEDEAVEMAVGALRALNAGDYEGWSENWSDTMKDAIDAAAFASARDQVQSQLGDFVAVTNVSGAPGETPGYYRWTFEVEFERGGHGMWLGFKEGSPLIEGVQFFELSA